MKKILFILTISTMFLFVGCTKMYNSNEVSLSNVNTELTFQTGVIVDIKNVVIKDDGSGAMLGGYTGTVLGSLFGQGKGNVLSTLFGGLAGVFVGQEVDKANAQELFIKLDNGKNIVVIVKGVDLKKGDKVRIIKRGYKIVRVEKI